MSGKERSAVAVVGCGQIAEWRHIPALRKIKDTEIVAICDKNEDLVKRLSVRYRIRRYYSDFAQMLHREKIDIVDICTPPQTHLALSTQAMAAGCHVLTEKPLALTVKELVSRMWWKKESACPTL